MEIRNVITIDKEILGGQPVFNGTRVAVESLFDHLEAGVLLDEFLDDFPGVTRQQAVYILEYTYTIRHVSFYHRVYKPGFPLYAASATKFGWAETGEADKLAVTMGMFKALGNHYKHGRSTFANSFYATYTFKLLWLPLL